MIDSKVIWLLFFVLAIAIFAEGIAIRSSVDRIERLSTRIYNLEQAK